MKKRSQGLKQPSRPPVCPQKQRDGHDEASLEENYTRMREIEPGTYGVKDLRTPSHHHVGFILLISFQRHPAKSLEARGLKSDIVTEITSFPSKMYTPSMVWNECKNKATFPSRFHTLTSRFCIHIRPRDLPSPMALAQRWWVALPGWVLQQRRSPSAFFSACASADRCRCTRTLWKR